MDGGAAMTVTIIPKFQCGFLPPDEASVLHEIAIRIRNGAKATTATIVATDRDLITVKQHLEHSAVRTMGGHANPSQTTNPI